MAFTILSNERSILIYINIILHYWLCVWRHSYRLLSEKSFKSVVLCLCIWLRSTLQYRLHPPQTVSFSPQEKKGKKRWAQPAQPPSPLHPPLSLSLPFMNTHSLLIKASSVANCSAAVGIHCKKGILIKLQAGNTVIKYECYIRNCQQGFLISL